MDLEINRAFYKPKGIDVFQFRPGAHLALTRRPNRNIGVATKRALLHVAVADPQVTNQGMHLAHEERPLPLALDSSGSVHQFQQRRAGSVEVNTGVSAQAFVHRFSGIFFQMRSGDAYAFLVPSAKSICRAPGPTIGNSNWVIW